MSDPFCPNGCAHVYDHVGGCHKEAPVTADTYRSLTNDRLLEMYEGTLADFHRYSEPHEYHRPTYMEAGNRGLLMKEEILRRMST